MKYFTLLGHDRGTYYYLPKSGGQVVPLRADQHSEANFRTLAPYRFWITEYGKDGQVGYKLAADDLIQKQHEIGIYKPDRVRGRGAWWDEGVGAVMHTGENIIIDGKMVPLKNYEIGKYIYELSEPLDIEVGSPMPASESKKVMDMFEAMSWAHPHNARLAAGWCVIAAICGAVKWRPHLWLSGPSGSGKSWVVTDLMRRLLGNLALTTLSETTGAGLRQTLGHDARPIIFDEAEAEGNRGDTRMAEVLSLMRQASSETGGAIIKGSADGTAKTYKVRSCFAMSSINISAYQAADKNRITVLEMVIDQSLSQKERDAKFAVICTDAAATMTDEFVSSWRARCVSLIPVIRENAQIFSVAAAGEIGSRRIGDQVGTLLAGAYAVLSDRVVTPGLALRLVQEQDLSDQKSLQKVSDEHDLLYFLLQQVVRVRCGFGTGERSMASLLRIASGGADEVKQHDAEDALGLVGIKALEDWFVIANAHIGIAKMLAGTRWGKDWARVLKRIPGSVSSEVVRIDGMSRRGTKLPWSALE